MNKIEISDALIQTTYLVTSFYGQEPLNPENSIGIGSGVAINAKGDLLTAAHVVTGRITVRPEDVNDPNVTYLAKTKAGQFNQYYPVRCGVGIQNSLTKEPITVDLALLRPISTQNDVPFLRLNRNPIKVGLEVLMAGFPDDMELPLSFDQTLDRTQPEVQLILRGLQIARQQLMMIKSGMIGYENSVTLTNGQLTLEGQVFYVDNQLQSGASGGPVVNQDAEVIGIITQRATTTVSYLDIINLGVPSGSTVAVSPRLLLPLIDNEIANR
jgi:S1-C subfamily serine protease